MSSWTSQPTKVGLHPTGTSLGSSKSGPYFSLQLCSLGVASHCAVPAFCCLLPGNQLYSPKVKGSEPPYVVSLSFIFSVHQRHWSPHDSLWFWCRAHWSFYYLQHWTIALSPLTPYFVVVDTVGSPSCPSTKIGGLLPGFADCWYIGYIGYIGLVCDL